MHRKKVPTLSRPCSYIESETCVKKIKKVCMYSHAQRNPGSSKCITAANTEVSLGTHTLSMGLSY